MNPVQVEACWKSVFPNSAITVLRFGGDYTYVFRLAANQDEVPNRIIQNDPLSYSVHINKAGTWSEYHTSLLVKPTTPNVVYSSVRFRRKTIKLVDEAKAVKRLHQVRAFVMENADNLNNPCFDIRMK